MVKIPIKSRNNTSYLLTWREKLTNNYSYTELLQLYLINFSNQTEAIKSFLIYLDLAKYFNCNQRKTSPSEQQLRIILALADNRNYKNIAQFLGIAYKTVEAHIYQLKHKLLFGSLEILVEELRKPKSAY